MVEDWSEAEALRNPDHAQIILSRNGLSKNVVAALGCRDHGRAGTNEIDLLEVSASLSVNIGNIRLAQCGLVYPEIINQSIVRITR